MKVMALMAALACAALLTACGPSFTEQTYDQDMCKLRANALCRQDANCPGMGSDQWRALVIECMDEQGYGEDEIDW